MSGFEKLIEAAKRGAVDDVKVILHSHPEWVNNRDELGATALHHAAFGGHRPVVRLLVQQGADINAPDAEFGARLSERLAVNDFSLFGDEDGTIKLPSFKQG